MTIVAEPSGDVAALQRRYDDLSRRHAVEMRLVNVAAAGRGIAGLVQEMAELTANPVWLIDHRRRVVARSVEVRGSDFRPPDVDRLLEHHGPVDLSSPEPHLLPAVAALDIPRRHLLVPVARGGCLYAWLVIAEVARRLGRDDALLASRAAFHLASEYVVQQRVARVSWNARSALARQLVRGSNRDDDLVEAAEYLGVRADADRIVVYLTESEDVDPINVEEVSDRVGRTLGVEVLGARGREGLILLVEAPGDAVPMALVHQAKTAVRRVVVDLGHVDVAVGVSGVTAASALQRSYREAREVAQCVDRFAGSGDRVIAVDDLGPARLFVANSDLGSVRRYVRDVLGGLLDEAPGTADLLRTLQCFFDTGRSVRESAGHLGIHENTVRLRLGKIHDLTGLDVAADANDQLGAQTALLVLRLEGHPAVPPFGHRYQEHLPDGRRRSA